MKTDREYNQLFETLMTYTSFTKVDQITTTQDLHQYFQEIKNNAETKGRKNPVTRKLKIALIEAYGRLFRAPIKHKIITEQQTGITSRPHKRFTTAKEKHFTFVHNNQEIYKTVIKHARSKKPIFVYRNKKGQFVKYEKKTIQVK